MIKIIKLFKYELIKILVFLFLFGSSLVFVLAAQGNYYYKSNYREYYRSNMQRVEKMREQNRTEN